MCPLASIDDDAKDGGQGRSDFCVVFAALAFVCGKLYEAIITGQLKIVSLSTELLFDTYMSSDSKVINISNDLSAQRIMVIVYI